MKTVQKRTSPGPARPSLSPSEISLAPEQSPRSRVLSIFVAVGGESGLFFREAFAEVLARGLPRLEAAGKGERLSLNWRMPSLGPGLPVICRKELNHQSPVLPSPEEGPQGQRKPRAAPRAGPAWKQPSEWDPRVLPCGSWGLILIPRRHEVLRASKDYNMGGLEPQKFIVSQFWRPKSSCGQATRPRKVLGKEIFQTSLLVASSIPSLADGGLPLTVSLQAVFSLYLSVSGSKLLPSIRTAALLFFFFFF